MSKRLINRYPDRGTALVLASLPFILLLIVYAVNSALRLTENPDDKLLPSFAQFGRALTRYALEPDIRTGKLLLWADTAASLERLFYGLGAATVLAALIGLAIGMIPLVRAMLAPMVSVLSMIPPLAVLPILFIIFGLGEVSKVVLIMIGVTPFMVRDLALRVMELPHEQIVKAQTLGASSWQIALRVVVPQMLPRLIDALRLSLGPAWLYLISAEAIASESGLGYRVFLVRRYLAMDVILPYVAWITLLAFLLDWLLRVVQRRAFPWFALGRAS